MLLNLSNHPFAEWQPEQVETALAEFGNVEDILFPHIDPTWDIDTVHRLAIEYRAQLFSRHPSAVHIMGELTFVYKVVCLLQECGIRCIASTTKRDVQIDHNGIKRSNFIFVRFRDYF